MPFGGFFGGSNSDDSSKHPSSTTPDLSSPVPGDSVTNMTIAGGSSSEIRQSIQKAIQTQSNLINAKYLIQKINENCFEHCVPEPGASLSSKEQGCLSTCMEKYIEGWNVVSKSYVGRLQKEGAGLGNGEGGGSGLF